MRICIIGDAEGNHDEGMKNIAYNIYKELKKKGRDEIIILSPKSIIFPSFWLKIKKFNPDIIHYIAGPTILSFAISKALKILYNTKIVVSMIHPRFLLSKYLIALLKPDMMLIQSHKTENFCKEIKCNYSFLPNGIDPEKFKPFDENQRDKIRKKYDVPNEKFVVLHVGNFREGRNLSILKEILDESTEVIIVGSTTISKDRTTYNELKKSGLRIIDEYVPHIEEIYNLADCYVFPTFDDNYCIEMPLSVMEAMACNLPVVTTRFGALPRVFERGQGLFFVNNEYELFKKLEKLKSKAKSNIRTRSKVLIYSWENVVKELRKTYLEILNDS